MAELRAAGEASGRLVEELKRARKELQERVSELELHLNTEREMGDKNKQLLAEEEAKGNELKVFISSLMKQKEAAIKSELERGETILTLESSLHEMGKELELVRE
jgi:CHASE3 domain sensor protein